MKTFCTFFFTCLLFFTNSDAQTLINPLTGGGFESGNNFALNGWTVVNSNVNKWVVGTATFFSGTSSAYISIDSSGLKTYSYDNSIPQISHFYQDIVIPAGAKKVELGFYYKGNYDPFGSDKLEIYVNTDLNDPIVANVLPGGSAFQVFFQMENNPAYLSRIIDVAAIADPIVPITVRIIFTWVNDGNGMGTNPPASVDAISLCVAPVKYNVTGGGGYCAGAAGVSIGLSNSQTGVSYQLKNGASPVGGPVNGTGAALDFGLQTVGGNYTVVATSGAPCNVAETMTGSATITVNPLPTVSAGGAFSKTCVTNASGAAIGEANESLTTYLWSPTAGLSSATVSNPTADPTATTTYTVTKTVTLTGCKQTADVTVTVDNALPVVNITGGSSICIGGTTTLSPTSGGTWTSSDDALATVTSAGVVSGVSAGTATFTFTVPASGCSKTTPSVSINTTPTLSSVSAAATCVGSPATINLTGLQPNTTSTINYSINGLAQTPVTGVVANASGTASFNTLVLTIAHIGQTLEVTGITITSPTPGCSQAFSNKTVMLTVNTTSIWLGVNTNWFDPQNWCGTIPSLTTDALIPGSLVNYPLLNAGAGAVGNITIQNTASVIVSGTKMQIAGTISNSGVFDATAGTIELKGSASPQSISGSWFVNKTIKSLVISNPSGVNVSSLLNDTLKILDSLAFGNLNNATLNTGDNIVIISTASGTARVADITHNNVNSGNQIVNKVTVERYYPAKRAWRLVTTPLSSAGNIFDSWQASGNYIAGRGMFVTGPNPTGSGGNGLDYSGFNNISMRGVNAGNTAYLDIINTKTTLLSTPNVTPNIATNIGYYAFVRGDRNRTPDNTVFGNANSTTLSSKGYLQTGNQTINISSGLGTFPLIGNPYASSVDFAKITKTNVYANRFYVHDPSINALGAYVVVENTIADPNTFLPTNFAPAASVQRNFIQSSQAFFVDPDGNGAASVTFHESDKSTDYNPQLFRPVTPAGRVPSFRTNLQLLEANKTTTLADGNYVGYDDQFNADVDLQDALKYSNIGENLGILRVNKFLAVERRPLIKDTDTIFFKLTKTTQRSYRLEFTPANLDPLLTAFLEDGFSGLRIPLSLAAVSKYDFSITADARSSVADRFRIVFKLPPPLMTNTIFAFQKGYTIAVEWKVENEKNISNYEVEKSADGVNFAKVNATPANGANQPGITYSWLDINPLTGDNYYRVRSIGSDGKIDFTKAVLVTMGKMNSGIRIYPNPVTEGNIGVEFKNMAAGVYYIRLLNSLGQAILTKNINHARGTSMENIKPDYKLTSGFYQLEVISPDKEITKVKLIVK